MRMKVLWFGVLVAAIVWVYDLYQTPEYEATAKVLVGEKSKDGSPYPIPNAPNTRLQTFTQTVARMIATMPVARAVAGRLNLPNGSAAKVRENTSAQTDPGTTFIDITYRDSDPKRAQQIANAIARVASQKTSEMSLGENRITATTLWMPATLPAAPVSPDPVRDGLIALVAGLVLGWAWTVVAPSLGLPPAAAR